VDLRPLSILSLCSGVGGLELGVKLALPKSRVICYVEREAFAISLLVQTMQKGYLDTAPIWSDLATFQGSPWRDKVDLITAGFPCQPWSSAGKRQGTKDKRWLWPHIFRIICEVSPRFIFLENSPGLRQGGLEIILKDLASKRYNAQWRVLGAHHVGAPHYRKRIWLLAYSSDHGTRWREQQQEDCQSTGNVADSDSRRQRACSEYAKAHHTSEVQERGWWEAEPNVGRVANGVSNRLDRIRALGNGVVPLAAAYALKTLLNDIGQYYAA